MNDIMSALLHPEELCSRKKIIDQRHVPKKSGIYAWYFKQIPPGVPTDGCHILDGKTLLYIGISPKAHSQTGAPPSRQNLHKRIKNHMHGNADCSTLRLTLGCLLRDVLKIELRRVGNGKRKTFASGEELLSEWMSENAFVAWVECDEPWKYEEQIIPNLPLPLNIQHNKKQSFYEELKKIRSEVKRNADSMPIITR